MGGGGGVWGVLNCGEGAAMRPPFGRFIRPRYSYLTAGNH